jgi:hypothetical protein
VRCDEFEIRLNELLDQRLRPESDVRLGQHARRCGKCRELSTSYQAVLAGLQNIRRAGRFPASNSAKHAWPRRMTAAAAAAAVLASVVGPWVWFARRSPDAWPLASVVQERTTPGAVKTGHGPRQAVPGRVETGATRRLDAGFAVSTIGPYRVLARETQASLSVALQLVPGLGQTDAHARETAPPTSPRVETMQPPAEWAQGLKDGLTPVTRPAAGVFSPFLELLSLPDEDPHS